MIRYILLNPNTRYKDAYEGSFRFSELTHFKNEELFNMLEHWLATNRLILTASGEEYSLVKELFPNIPNTGNIKFCTWYGDDAKFIFRNLLDLFEGGYLEDE